MARDDYYGMFWTDPVRERVTKNSAPKSLPPVPDTGWHLPEGPELYPDLRGQGMIAIDVESNDPYLTTKGPGYIRGDAYVCGVAVGTEAGFRRYYPVAHENSPHNLPKKHVFGWLNEQLSRPGQPKVGANILYDLEALHFSGVKVEGPFYDVQAAEALLDETRLSYALDVIAQARLSDTKVQDEMLTWLRKAFGNIANIKKFIHKAPCEVVGPYAESDVDLPLRLIKVQRKALEREGLLDLFENVESKLIPMLLAMRLRGVRIDTEHAERLLDRLNTTFDESIDGIKQLVGFKPDIWAPDSLAKLFDKAGVEYPITPKTKKPSIRKEWLAQQAHPVAKMVRDARHMDKFRGTFVQGYLLDSNVNGRIHCQFHQLRSDEGGTVSGRFSSSLPNLQNIPTRTAEGKLIREAFLADAGMRWWKFDWSQIEYRLIAHYAYITNQPGIQDVINAYWNDPSTDYHQAVAELTGLSRSDAKNLNFGLAYGQGVDLLCSNLGVERAEGERIMAEYHEKAPFIRKLASMVSEQADKAGFIKTLLGRRRRFNVWERSRHANDNEYAQESNLGPFAALLSPEQEKRWRKSLEQIDESELGRSPLNEQYLWVLRRSGWRRAFLHKALNALIQGSAADIMKKAMVQIWESGVCDVLGAPHLTVHDELDGSYDPANREHIEALEHVKYIMENCHTFSVPIIAEGGTGENWGSLKEAA